MAAFDVLAFDDVNSFFDDAFDFTSLTIVTTRAGWYTLWDVFHEAEFITLMRVESNGPSVWCSWAAGVNLPTDPVPKNNGNLELDYAYFRTAATGATAWARFSPGSVSQVRGDIEIDMQAAELANFAL